MNPPEGKDERSAGTEQEGITGPRERHLTMLNNRLDSKELFVGTQEIVIVHGREEYHLRLTAQNKLILTK
jgi:hemin uptake protein HemP